MDEVAARVRSALDRLDDVSLTGAPAVLVPVGAGAVQVVAARWCDHVAVAVARLLESAGA